MSGRDIVFGVFFSSDEDQIDIEEVKNDFRKYGKIAFVTQHQKRVFVNFTTQEEAENCLSSSPDPKYGKVKRGKFGTESQNSKEMNGNQNGYRRSATYSFKKADRNEMKMQSPRESESEESRSGYDPHRRESQMIPNSHSVPRSRIAERKSVPYESKYSSSDRPPPLVSANDGPPPLVSVNVGPPTSQSFDNSLLDSPPPLISALETNPPVTPRSSRNGSSNGKGLLPTPPLYLHKIYNPDLMNLSSQHISNPTSVPDSSDIPQLVSAVSQPLKKRQEHAQSLSYEDYLHKYGSYVLIVNIPEDITVDEIEKILYPHIPVCICEPELTNIRMKVLFCLVGFSTKTEATKASRQLDGVEVRGQCLNMIRLDELLLFSDVPF